MLLASGQGVRPQYDPQHQNAVLAVGDSERRRKVHRAEDQRVRPPAAKGPGPGSGQHRGLDSQPPVSMAGVPGSGPGARERRLDDPPDGGLTGTGEHGHRDRDRPPKEPLMSTDPVTAP